MQKEEIWQRQNVQQKLKRGKNVKTAQAANQNSVLHTRKNSIQKYQFIKAGKGLGLFKPFIN